MTVNNLVSAVATFTTILFFIYTVKVRGPVRVASRIGRLAIMTAFGASLGAAQMRNFGFSIGVLLYLLTEGGRYVAIPGLVIIVGHYLLGKRRKSVAGQSAP